MKINLILIIGLISGNVLAAELKQGPHSVPLLRADQMRSDSSVTQTRSTDDKKMSKGEKLCCGCCLGSCGIGCIALFIYLLTNKSGPECTLDHDCLPATTSLRENCFGMNVCQEPKQVFCPYPGTVQNFSFSDQARFFLKKPSDQLCVKMISCKDLSCLKQKQD